MRLDFSAWEARLAVPVVTAHGVLEVRRGWIVLLRTPDGVVGRGEASPWEAFGTEAPEATLAALQAFELRAVPESVEEVAVAVEPLQATPAAQAGVEAALLEHLANRRGVPVAALLSPAPASSVESGALIDGADARELVVAAEGAVQRGFGTLKLKVGARPLAVDAQRVHAVRRAVGAGVKLRLDANGAWSESVARAALRGLETLDLELCEQPVAAGDVEALRRVSHLVPCVVAADEALLTSAGREAVLASDRVPAAKVLVLKPMALGGLLPSLELARRAAAVGVASYVTTLLDGPLARAAAVHLAAALPPGGHAHGLSTPELFVGARADAFTPRVGRIMLPTGAGWGLP